MRDTRMWKRLACAAMVAAVAGSLLAGCGSSDADAAAETATTTAEATTEAATEAAESDAESNPALATESGPAVEGDTEVNPALATESGPVVEGDDATDDGTLAPFVYVGNSEESRLCTAFALEYAAPDYADSERDDVVTIPAWTIVEETDNADGLELLANVYVYVFELDGTTLRFVAGGANPCRIQATGSEITNVETSLTDEDTLALCNGDEDLVRALNDQDAISTSLQNNVGMYVNNYGYDIDAYEISGETVNINH